MNRLLVLCTLLALYGCVQNEKLPIMGEKTVVEKTVAGKTLSDTLDHSIAAFALLNQDSTEVTEQYYKGKYIYITDFFFTSCPTICPKMKTQMLRLYKHFENNEDVKFLSHSIDPRHDTPTVLKKYSEKLGINTQKWQFVTGQKEKIYELAAKSYITSALEDAKAEGGFMHSGAFVLVDKNLHIRAIYDGTIPSEADKMIVAIEQLLNEK
jgi:protein SCO1